MVGWVENFDILSFILGIVGWEERTGFLWVVLEILYEYFFLWKKEIYMYYEF